MTRILTHPLTILAAILTGAATGMLAPDFAASLKFIGAAYIDLLKMVVLPFLVSAVIVSISRLVRDSAASQYLGRSIVFLLAGMALASMAGVLYMHLAAPGSGLDQQALQAFGKLVQADLSGVETSVHLLAPHQDAPHTNVASQLLARLVPDNIFSALSLGDTLKSLVFALLFGFAVASVPGERAHSLIDSCDTVFRACQRMTAWMLYLLPPASFVLAAGQFAGAGIEPFHVMLHFLLAFAVVTALLLALCIFILWRRSGRSLATVLRSQEAPFFIALASRNSVACMPAMMSALVERLGFDKRITELLVPLGTALFRVGPALYYSMAAVFIAQLYGRELGAAEYGVVVLAAVIAGFASTGMSGVVTISQTAVVCGLLGLPFEAAFVLFVAIEPMCDTLRTVLLVIAINALVALTAPRQARQQPSAGTVATSNIRVVQ
ncbi:Na+/H+-dicarboxylate symporter [Paucimonas lemoignei]|uniref:Na+/H+-dicarboxylate symporter n=1 Tax=Paucimonas lemoignei TaxID=29443 RepID=A0A4R3HXJ4_PAULE|nr:cation:dicarboxylase symporter family transporter [Paucimonas lemoignei]TCS37554.1 Na+/H+-dicarboxylate symporter [Paucimonas lemoignei]